MTEMAEPDAQLWAARTAVFAHFARTGRALTLAGLAAALDVDLDDARAMLLALNERHLLLLAADGESIHMAHPFSGIPTVFRTQVAGVDYFANCAWDALGIAAALGRDAEIVIGDPLGGPDHHIAIRNGQVQGDGIVHFLVPFAHWYDDLVYT